MISKELKSWRIILNALRQYGLYELLEKEIDDVVKVLKRGGIDE